MELLKARVFQLRSVVYFREILLDQSEYSAQFVIPQMRGQEVSFSVIQISNQNCDLRPYFLF